LLTLFTGCASTICGPKQNITLNSKPSGAEVLVYNAQCDIVFEGTTPCVANLLRRAPEDDRPNYIILVKKSGYLPVQIPLIGRVNRACLANTLNGGIGFLPDSMSGAMWTLASNPIEPQLFQDTPPFIACENGFSVSLKEQATKTLATRLSSTRD
jgi:hypothetical protein